MSFIKEFREFAVRGNAIDMAVGITVGAAFGKIVSSFVSDVVMPPIGLLISGVNFSKLSWVLKPEIGATPAVTLNYGAFIQNLFDFVIIAFAIFMLVKLINSLKRQGQQDIKEQPIIKTQEETLLEEIRDLLKNKN
ncbi:MAG: large-conductance mechanosensitive channel protein MscL [Candidatus Caenarcaniphilales bacterium]|nr:large-conductance mechanosensitive channel protein MscL [Candidatus Caenarcaniphilales bacterium]